MTGPDLPGIGGLSQAYLSGQLTPSAVLEDTLARIAAVDPNSPRSPRSTPTAPGRPPRRPGLSSRAAAAGDRCTACRLR